VARFFPHKYYSHSALISTGDILTAEQANGNRVWQEGGWEKSSGDIAMTNLASDVVKLRLMVARLNIELFCKKLAEEMNETKRRTLLQLIVEEKEKVSALSPIT
jgi:hypothetical protein